MAPCRTALDSAFRGNAFLRSLKPADAALIAPLMTLVECRSGEHLALGEGAAGVLHFPLTLVVSIGLDADGGGWGLICLLYTSDAATKRIV